MCTDILDIEMIEVEGMHPRHVLLVIAESTASDNQTMNLEVEL